MTAKSLSVQFRQNETCDAAKTSKGESTSELITQSERELAETKRLVAEQSGVIERLKRIRADKRQALLIDLLGIALSSGIAFEQ
jgi:hypothetical protein